MRVTRGLVIDSHWVSLILAGTKTWEMRSQPTNLRGTISLIRKGTGRIWGVVDLVDCGSPLSDEEMLASIERHQVPESMIRSGEIASWRIPWVLENAISFADPVPYEHPNGAVKWVQLSDQVSDQIAERLQKTGAHVAEVPPRHQVRSETVRRPAQALSDMLRPLPELGSEQIRIASPLSAVGTIIGRTTATEGNLKNNHLYLRGFFDKFPADAVGGSNRSSPAKSHLKVRWRGSEWHETDLDGQKLFFRSRSLVRKFFEDTGAEAGDDVDVECVEPYHYVLHLRKVK
jgi:hypothetical protein